MLVKKEQDRRPETSYLKVEILRMGYYEMSNRQFLLITPVVFTINMQHHAHLAEPSNHMWRQRIGIGLWKNAGPCRSVAAYCVLKCVQNHGVKYVRARTVLLILQPQPAPATESYGINEHFNELINFVMIWWPQAELQVLAWPLICWVTDQDAEYFGAIVSCFVNQG